MYLIDTDVISEARKGDQTNGAMGELRASFARPPDNLSLYLSAVTIGELRQGVAFDAETAQVWGRMRVPHPQNPLDKQIAATALINNLTAVTRNTAHYQPTGVLLLNPFT